MILKGIRCLLFGCQWRYASMPNDDRVISRDCTRCGRFEVKPATSIPDQLSRIRDTRKIRHLFTRSGWPR